MSNFDDIFEPAPQAEDFDKEAWAAKKKAELLPTPPLKKSAQTAASSVTIWMCRQNFIATPLLTPF